MQNICKKEILHKPISVSLFLYEKYFLKLHSYLKNVLLTLIPQLTANPDVMLGLISMTLKTLTLSATLRPLTSLPTLD